MGCWNGTCALSNLPIQEGDEILLFVLKPVQQTDVPGGGIVYATDLYAPVGLPVHGQYNDYGGIEDISKNEDIMFDFLSNDRVHAVKINDNANVKKPESLEELLNDVIERGESDLSFMLVRKDILDGLKSSNTADYNSLAHHHKEFSDTYNLEIEKFKENDDENRYNAMLHASLIEMGLSRKIPFSNLFMRLLESYEIPSIRNFVRESVKNPAANYQDGIADVYYVNLLLSYLRKFWTPQTGAGSQDNEHNVHLALCDTMREVCAKRDAERDSWDDE